WPRSLLIHSPAAEPSLPIHRPSPSTTCPPVTRVPGGKRPPSAGGHTAAPYFAAPGDVCTHITGDIRTHVGNPVTPSLLRMSTTPPPISASRRALSPSMALQWIVVWPHHHSWHVQP